jgi:hypothetical protein
MSVWVDQVRSDLGTIVFISASSAATVLLAKAGGLSKVFFWFAQSRASLVSCF